MRGLYEQTDCPEPSRKTMQKLLIFTVKKIHFKSNGLCYVQNDVKLAVILANLRLKESEPVLIKENPKLRLLNEDNNLNAKC